VSSQESVWASECKAGKESELVTRLGSLSASGSGSASRSPSGLASECKAGKESALASAPLS
jgi:hypothetical protein